MDNEKLKELLKNPETQEKLNNFLNNPPNIVQNIFNKQLEKTEYQFTNEEDCPNYILCTKLNISVPSICAKNGDSKNMCSFAESRIILLLSKIVSNGG